MLEVLLKKVAGKDREPHFLLNTLNIFSCVGCDYINQELCHIVQRMIDQICHNSNAIEE